MSINSVSSQPIIGGVNPDDLKNSGQPQSINAHTPPGTAGEPGEGNSSAPGSLPGHENTLNLEVTPDQLLKNKKQ